MGQAVKPWLGDSHRLGRALALKDKLSLTSQELACLVEGGRLCNRHGLRLLCSGRENPDVAQNLNALLTTSRTLLARALRQLQENDGISVPNGNTGALSLEAGEAWRESAYLAHWAGRMSDREPARPFDA